MFKSVASLFFITLLFATACRRQLVEREGVVPLIQKAIQEQLTEYPGIHNQGIRILVNLAANTDNASDLAQQPISRVVVSSMRKHIGDQKVVIAGLMFMQNISYVQDQAAQTSCFLVLSCAFLCFLVEVRWV